MMEPGKETRRQGVRRIKLMADYQCFPLWEYEEDGARDVDPESLPISPALKKDLIDWAERLDSSLDWSDPGGTVWPPGFWTGFNERGAELAKRLQEELGPDVQVEARLWGGGDS